MSHVRYHWISPSPICTPKGDPPLSYMDYVCGGVPSKVVRIPILLPESYDLMILHHRIDPNPTTNPNRIESMLGPDPNHRIL